MCVCCVRVRVSVFDRLSSGLLSDLDSNVLSFCFSTSLTPPYATVWHFNRLLLLLCQFLTLTVTLEYSGPRERPALVCYRLHSAYTYREWWFHTQSTVSLVPVRVFTPFQSHSCSPTNKLILYAPLKPRNKCLNVHGDAQKAALFDACSCLHNHYECR